ncbi:MAG: hypothetical protein IKH30_01425 [Clostridia bacterium]|nr:hypothetical protein [Clostridia bacterium]
MKKMISLVVAMVMMCTVLGALAEGQLAPLYATVGEALEDDAEGRVIAGGEGSDEGYYYAVVTRKDGKYYRSVAYYDETMMELQEASNNLDFEADDFFEKLEAAMNAADEYVKTLPIAYSEEFTAVPLTDEEMAAKAGKTLAQLTEEGFEIGSNGTEPGEGEDEMIIVYSLRYGVFDYFCEVDTDFDHYIEAQENGEEGDLVVKSMTLAGITEWGFAKRFHTDGTVEEPEDPFAEMGEILTEVAQLVEKAQAGEEIDLEGFAGALKEKYPNYADMIDMYVLLYKTYGAEGLAPMVNPAE